MFHDLTEEVLDAMSKPGFYPHKVREIRKAETHTAWVFLTGSKAYKLKKPVNFGFLDFSTLDKRKEFCEKEVKLNRLLSDLYIGVEPITRDEDGRLVISGNGEPLEYIVVMKELPQESLMSSLLKNDKIDYHTIDGLAKEIAKFHKSAETSEEITKEGSLENVRFNWEENFQQTENVKDITLSSERFESIRKNVFRFLENKKEDFRKREKEGFIKYCHGDLHSGNIFIYEDKIHIFDRIEFNMRFACSDTAADLAFMTMDLDFHSKRELSDFLLMRYLDITQDYSLLKFHDFFRCYRAYVRGKVIGFQLSQNPRDAQEIKRRASAYFDSAELYASTLFSKPRLIVFYGLPGTGKTYLASRTRDWTNAIHIRADVVRRVIAGVSLDEHHYAGFGSDLYSAEISKRVYDYLARQVKLYLSQGQSLIIDATCHKEKNRLELKKAADELGVESFFIRTDAAPEKVREWIEKRKTSDLLSDATLEIYSEMKNKFEPEGSFPYSTIVTGRAPQEMDSDIKKMIGS